MKAFLIEFDRRREKSHVTVFDDRELAIRTLNEREAARASHEEVVLLFADSEESIRKTHSRYFHTLAELATKPLSA